MEPAHALDVLVLPAVGVERRISAAGSRTSVWVIPTNEELLIARDTVRAVEPAG